MKLKTKYFYWSPFLTPIATPKAVINSAHSLQKFSKQNNCSIINFFGEFNVFKEELEHNKINTINYFGKNFINFFPKYGKIKSRLSFIFIFILSFFPLKRLLVKEKPNFLIIHLITSLPLFLLLIFNFETKFILRISGLPQLGVLRKFLWRISLKKIYLVTCPTINTMNYIKSLNIVSSEKIQLLYDPVINIEKIRKNNLIKNKKNIYKDKKYFLAVGRFTKQKNFTFLCKAFNEITKKYPDLILLIAGDGEEKNDIQNYINKNSLEKKIFLIGYVENIFHYMKESEGFILSSLWEDPGFVLLEAAFSRTPILSSNCGNGPIELIKEDFNGILFDSNNINNFVIKFEKFINEKKNSNKLILNSLKMSKNFTLFSHYLKLNKILSGLNQSQK